jgi:vacuolar protein sorting-associated protein 13A/C
VLEGFLLEARPIDLSALTASESQRLVLNYKLGIIEAAERAITAMLHTNSSSSSSGGGDSGGKKLSYLQQLTIKIIDNIEVKVSNVHLRFEDTLVVSGGKLPGRELSIACGLTIDSLTFSTTDSAWKTTFISRGDVDHRADDSPKHGVPIIHKLAVLKNLGVYWNPIAVSSETKSFSEWVHKMTTLIRDASTGNSRSAIQSMSTDNDDNGNDKESIQYIVHPSNQCSLKMKHCSISSDLQPNVDLHVSSDPLMISISDEQLHQIIYVANFFADLNRRKLMISLRPKVRPTVDPRAWWQYAYKMITGVHDKFISKVLLMLGIASSY